MARYYRYTNLTTKGNLPLVPSGQDVISSVKGQLYNFEAGRLIIYDPTTGKTLDAGGIATAKAIRVGVGHNPSGGYMATEIRHLGSKDIDLCRTGIDAKVEGPSCATPQVVDLEFACTFTGTDYSVQFDVDDWLRRSYFKEGQYGTLLYSMRSEIKGCENCSDEENCNQLACQLAAKVNNKFVEHFPNTSKLGLNTDKPGHGLWAVQKFEKSWSFNLSVTDCAVKGLKEFTASDGVSVTFVNAVHPSDGTVTPLEQLQTVIDQINAAIEGKGSAYLKRKGCCEYSIEINTCLTTLAMKYHDDASVDSSNEDAFSAFTESDLCDGCDAPESNTYTCGIRVFVDPLELPCHCEYPNGNPPSYYGRTVKIVPVGDGWNNTPFRTVEVEKQEVWRGTGFQVQLNEYKQSVGGEGFGYELGMDYTDGNLPIPNPGSAAAEASVAKCDDMYCVWSLVTLDAMPGHSHSRLVHNSQTVNWVNIPYEDDTTIGDFEGALTALKARGLCNDVEVECFVNAQIGITINGETEIDNTEPGGTSELSVTIDPDSVDAAGTWSSSNEGVATVDANGVVTAVADGTTTITYTNTETGQTQTIDITVTNTQ